MEGDLLGDIAVIQQEARAFGFSAVTVALGSGGWVPDIG